VFFMKKLFSVLAVLFVMGTTSVFATGLGLQGGPVVGDGVVYGGAITFKLNSAPCVFAVNLASFTPLAVGVTADWWIGNPSISGTWGWYYGVGVAGAVYLSNHSASVGVYGRALVGTNVFLLKKFLELYINIAWQPGIKIDNGVDPILVSFPIDFGFRFWF
ncbi:MAG: hypothetical protein K5866_05230, partial [Treponema sp.]|nr:hypothetical protein [Treponema sp.]